MEQDKKAKLLKEINDIMQEQEHIKNLFNENNLAFLSYSIRHPLFHYFSYYLLPIAFAIVDNIPA